MSKTCSKAMDRPKQSRRKRILLGGIAGGVVVLIIIIALVVGLRKKNVSKTKTSILFPLYVYPDPGAWDPLYDAINTYPKTKFTVVINPASGPVPAAEISTQYQNGVQRLNSYKNVKTIGYVSTNYGKRDLSLVTSDVKTYSVWNALLGNGSMSMHGIFFDEVMGHITDTSRDYMQTANQAVKSQAEFKPQQMVVHNNGVIPDYKRELTTDLVIAFEGTYTQYKERQTSIETLGRKDRSKHCVLMHSLPINQSKEDLKRLVKEVSQHAATLYFTDLSKDYYEQFGLSFKDFVAAVDSL